MANKSAAATPASDPIWLQSYPQSVPANIDALEHQSLGEMLDESFTNFARRPAFDCMGKTLSYVELDAQSRAFGAYLQSLGLSKGDRVALMIAKRSAISCGSGRSAESRDDSRQRKPALHPS